MSSLINVNVEQRKSAYDTRWVLKFNAKINDSIEPSGSEDCEDLPRITGFMAHAFEKTSVANKVEVSMHTIEFSVTAGRSIQSAVAGLLELLVSFIGPRMFLVYMPR
jgi:hypothetical protein